MFSFYVNFLFNIMPSTSVYWQPTAWWMLCLPDIFQVFLYLNWPQAETLCVRVQSSILWNRWIRPLLQTMKGKKKKKDGDMMYGRRCRHGNEGNECPHPVVTWPWLQKMIMTHSFHLYGRKKRLYVYIYIYGIYTYIFFIYIYIWLFYRNS